MLNSTGRVMYIETSNTITETVMLALINTSSRKLGIGMIIASTMPKTVSGTASSERFPKAETRLELFADCGAAGFPAARGGVGTSGPVPMPAALIGPIWDGAAIVGVDDARHAPALSAFGPDYSDLRLPVQPTV